MFNSHSRLVMLTVLTLPLGACNSFLGIHFARHAAPAPAAPAMAAQQPDPATQLGRRQLADGQTGLAIESFQRALAAGEPIAPAVNGLGVAYARIGRYDLAQRFFQQAMATNPAEPRYAENFAMLLRSPALALRHDGDIANAVFPPAEPATAQVQPARTAGVTAQPGKLQRVSSGEVRIVTAPLQSAPTARAGITIDKRFTPLIRISLADTATPPAPAANRAVVRFRLPEPEAKRPATATGTTAHRR